MKWRCGLRRQRRSWQGPRTKAYRQRTLRRRNAARGVDGKQGTPSYFADRPLARSEAIWHSSAASPVRDGAVSIDVGEHHLLLLDFVKPPDEYVLREFTEATVQGSCQVVATAPGTPTGLNQTTVGEAVEYIAGLVFTDLKKLGRTSGRDMAFNANFVQDQEVLERKYSTTSPGFGDETCEFVAAHRCYSRGRALREVPSADTAACPSRRLLTGRTFRHWWPPRLEP